MVATDRDRPVCGRNKNKKNGSVDMSPIGWQLECYASRPSSCWQGFKRCLKETQRGWICSFQDRRIRHEIWSYLQKTWNAWKQNKFRSFVRKRAREKAELKAWWRIVQI